MDYLHLTMLPNSVVNSAPEWERGKDPKTEEESFSFLGKAASPFAPDWLFIAKNISGAVFVPTKPADLGLPPEVGIVYTMACKFVKSRKSGQVLVFCDGEGNDEDLVVVRPYDRRLAKTQPEMQEDVDRKRQAAVQALSKLFSANCKYMPSKIAKIDLDNERVDYAVDIFVLGDRWRPNKAAQGLAEAQARVKAFLHDSKTTEAPESMQASTMTELVGELQASVEAPGTPNVSAKTPEEDRIAMASIHSAKKHCHGISTDAMNFTAAATVKVAKWIREHPWQAVAAGLATGLVVILL